jgi:hypothetical protein
MKLETLAPQTRDYAQLFLLDELAFNERSFACVDISNGGSDRSIAFDWLLRHVPRRARSRLALTRWGNGHVGPAERAWIKCLGFVDLIPEFDPADNEIRLHALLDELSQRLATEPPPPRKLEAYLRVFRTPGDPQTPRALIRRLTGQSAEAVAALLADELAIHDRSYRTTLYPRCFVGSEATDWVAEFFRLSRGDAQSVGQALGALGLIHHVEHDHDFHDKYLFFRLALSGASGIDMSLALAALLDASGVEVKDRSHLGRTYPACWTGTEAVDVLTREFSVARHAARATLADMQQLGWIAHVVDRQPIIDGPYFYRFRTDAGVLEHLC